MKEWKFLGLSKEALLDVGARLAPRHIGLLHDQGALRKAGIARHGTGGLWEEW